MYRFVDDNELQTVDMGDGDWIKIPTRLSYGFVSQFGDMKTGENDMGKIMGFLVKLVKEWNFQLSDGTVAPITQETLSKLEIGTINKMVESITPLMTVEKKDLVA